MQQEATSSDPLYQTMEEIYTAVRADDEYAQGDLVADAGESLGMMVTHAPAAGVFTPSGQALVGGEANYRDTTETVLVSEGGLSFAAEDYTRMRWQQDQSVKRDAAAAAGSLVGAGAAAYGWTETGEPALVGIGGVSLGAGLRYIYRTPKKVAERIGANRLEAELEQHYLMEHAEHDAYTVQLAGRDDIRELVAEQYPEVDAAAITLHGGNDTGSDWQGGW